MSVISLKMDSAWLQLLIILAHRTVNGTGYTILGDITINYYLELNAPVTLFTIVFIMET